MAVTALLSPATTGPKLTEALGLPLHKARVGGVDGLAAALGTMQSKRSKTVTINAVRPIRFCGAFL